MTDAEPGRVLDVAHHVKQRADPAALLQDLVDDQDRFIKSPIELAQTVGKRPASRSCRQALGEELPGCGQASGRRFVNAGQRDALLDGVRSHLLTDHRLTGVPPGRQMFSN